MSNKYLHYAELSEIHGKHIVSDIANWTGMLTTAARMYKYSFDEQLLIHAQKPEATACAEYDTWKKPVGRYVKRGSKGIALLDESDGKQRLRYVFDVSDTGEGRSKPNKAYVWQMKPEHETLVAEGLGRSLDEIPALAALLAKGYIEEHKDDIAESLEMAGFEDLQAFETTLAESAAYMILSRCGLDTSKLTENGAFRHINSFNDTNALKALGEGISKVSEDVLREIESIIKNHDREQARLAKIERSVTNDRQQDSEPSTASRNNLSLGGQRTDTRHNDSGGRGQLAVSDALGDNAQELLEGQPPDSLQEVIDGGGTVQALFGSGERSGGNVRHADGSVISEEPANNGRIESDRPNEVGTGNERIEDASGRSDKDGIDLQLRETTELNKQTKTPSTGKTAQVGGFSMPENEIANESMRETADSRASTKPQQSAQLSLFDVFPSEEAQKAAIKEAEEAEATSQPPVAITQEDIKNALVEWNNDIASKIRVYEFLAYDGSARGLDTADYLKNEFGGDLDGITVVKADSAPVIVPWDKVQQHISVMLDEGQFLTPVDWDFYHEQKNAEKATEIQQAPVEASGIMITRAVAETFRNPNDPSNGFLYAHDESGQLFITNKHFIFKPEEQDISKVTEQLNLYRNADRRRKQLPPLTAVENTEIIKHVTDLNNRDEDATAVHALDKSRSFSFKPYSDSNHENILFTDGAKYFMYQKELVDVFGENANLFVENADSYDSHKHKLIIADDNGGTVGVILPMGTTERMYEKLADTFPLDVPYKTRLERIKENPRNDPYIGREFFDGRNNVIVASLESVRAANKESDTPPDPYYLVCEINKDGTVSNGGIYVNAEHMEERIVQWEANREAAEARKIQEELKAQADAQAKEIYEHTHGFADNLPPMQKARVLETLDKGFNTKEYGNLTTKAFIEAAIQNGCTVEAVGLLKKKYESGEYTISDYEREFVHNAYEQTKMRKAAVSVRQDGDINSEYANFLKENHPYVHYLTFHDKAVLPDCI